MTSEIKIGQRIIGEGKPCFIIAEAGVNHNGDIEIAKKLIDVAKECGIDCVKFQTWITEEITTKQAEQADYQIENTKKKESQFDMLKRLELSFDDFRALKRYCDRKGIMFMSTPDDEKSADFLDSIDVPAFKIGSGELTNHLMLKKIAEKKKPVILSTGMADLDEIEEAVNIISDSGNNDLILLHCTTDYPVKLEDINLRAILTLENKFNKIIGFSDHTLIVDPSVAAVLMGAKVIEKHFTLDTQMEGPDHKASLNPEQLKELVDRIRAVDKLDQEEKKGQLKEMQRIEIILGKPEKRPTESEIAAKGVVRKSVVAKNDIPKGTIVTEDMLTMKRPGTGIKPGDIEKIIGKVTKTDIKYDDLIQWDDIECEK